MLRFFLLEWQNYIMKKLNNVIITGGAGFIGSNLVALEQKVVEGKIYAILDTFGKSIEKIVKRMDHLRILGLNCIPLATDIRKYKRLGQEILTSLYAIFHLAAISDTTSKNENVVLDINFNTFQQIIELSDFFYAPLIYASSGSVYGSKISHSTIGCN